MRLQFGRPKVQLIEKYNGRSDPRDHLEKWTNAYGAQLQPKLVHFFCHTLDVIPMNWYLEIELCHGMDGWNILRQICLMTFIFEYGFECIDEVL